MTNIIKKNIWQIVTFIASMVIAWTILTVKVENMELKVEEIEAKQGECIDTDNEVLQRLVRLETKIDILLNGE